MQTGLIDFKNVFSYINKVYDLITFEFIIRKYNFVGNLMNGFKYLDILIILTNLSFMFSLINSNTTENTHPINRIILIVLLDLTKC